MLCLLSVMYVSCPVWIARNTHIVRLISALFMIKVNLQIFLFLIVAVTLLWLVWLLFTSAIRQHLYGDYGKHLSRLFIISFKINLNHYMAYFYLFLLFLLRILFILFFYMCVRSFFI